MDIFQHSKATISVLYLIRSGICVKCKVLNDAITKLVRLNKNIDEREIGLILMKINIRFSLLQKKYCTELMAIRFQNAK